MTANFIDANSQLCVNLSSNAREIIQKNIRGGQVDEGLRLIEKSMEVAMLDNYSRFIHTPAFIKARDRIIMLKQAGVV